jgi:hypothetical protein
MVIRVITGTLSLVLGMPPHRKTTRLYAGDEIHIEEGQHLEIIADAPSSAEFTQESIDKTKTARPRSADSLDAPQTGPSPPA